MRKFWMMVAMVLTLGLTTGCPDDTDDCASDPSLCDPDSNTDTDAGADADADSDSDVAEDDGTAEDDAAPEADGDGSTTTCDECYLDPTTSLYWQNPSLNDLFTWEDAMAYCASLSLAGHGPGSWRLPTISELRSLVRGCPASETGGSCGVTDACLDRACSTDECFGCAIYAGPGAGGAYWPEELSEMVDPDRMDMYWSSSEAGNVSNAWVIGFGNGRVLRSGKENQDYVRCVHPGP